MIHSRVSRAVRGLAIVATVSLLGAAAVQRPAEAVPNFDGIWSVVIMTQQGICDASYRYPIRIAKGNLVNAGNAQVTITGKVEKNGAIVVNVAAGDKTATGTGRLAGKAGAGSWSGGNGACSGVWQAERRS